MKVLLKRFESPVVRKAFITMIIFLVSHYGLFKYLGFEDIEGFKEFLNILDLFLAGYMGYAFLNDPTSKDKF